MEILNQTANAENDMVLYSDEPRIFCRFIVTQFRDVSIFGKRDRCFRTAAKSVEQARLHAETLSSFSFTDKVTIFKIR